MTIEIVDFPINSMVDLSIVMLVYQRAIKGSRLETHRGGYHVLQVFSNETLPFRYCFEPSKDVFSQYGPDGVVSSIWVRLKIGYLQKNNGLS